MTFSKPAMYRLIQSSSDFGSRLNGDASTMTSLETSFGCCRANSMAAFAPTNIRHSWCALKAYVNTANL